MDGFAGGLGERLGGGQTGSETGAVCYLKLCGISWKRAQTRLADADKENEEGETSMKTSSQDINNTVLIIVVISSFLMA